MLERRTEPITITDTDLKRLLPVLDQHHSSVAESLDMELHRAAVVRQDAIGPDVVTMNSKIVYEDVNTCERRTVQLVYPKDADVAQGRLSVLAPIGSALLGLRVGQSIEWEVPKGNKRVRVVELQYQPEASGDFHL